MVELYIGFSTPKNKNKVGALAIRWWMGKPYSHVFVAWKSKTHQKTLVYHAAHGNVHFVEFKRFAEENNVIKLYKLSIPETSYKGLVGKCIDLAGISYGYLELVKILAYDICDSLNVSIKMSNDKGYICSELLADLLLELGVTFDRPTFLLRPDHIENALISLRAMEADEKELLWLD